MNECVESSATEEDITLTMIPEPLLLLGRNNRRRPTLVSRKKGMWMDDDDVYEMNSGALSSFGSAWKRTRTAITTNN
jgi:hypothetical protein